jgi:uncharacterized membrane protein HdeD (DUF308 family)
MKEVLAGSWWTLAIRGLFALLFGILAVLWPGLTLVALVALFAAYAIIGGVVSLVAAIKSRESDKGWWLVMLLGLVSIGAGAIAVFAPGLTALALVLLMGANAFITGIFDIAVAIRLRKVLEREWMLVLSGIVSIVFGVLVMAFPGAGALAMVWLISFYAVLTGILLLAVAFKLRSSTPGEGSTRKSTVGAT